jgi:hypothetical protein
MIIFESKIFDDILLDSTACYSEPTQIGVVQQIVFSLLCRSLSTSSSLIVKVQTSFDGQHWVDHSGSPEINGAITDGVVECKYITVATDMLGPYVRLELQGSGRSSHVRVHMIGRATKKAQTISMAPQAANVSFTRNRAVRQSVRIAREIRHVQEHHANTVTIAPAKSTAAVGIGNPNDKNIRPEKALRTESKKIQTVSIAGAIRPTKKKDYPVPDFTDDGKSNLMPREQDPPPAPTGDTFGPSTGWGSWYGSLGMPGGVWSNSGMPSSGSGGGAGGEDFTPGEGDTLGSGNPKAQVPGDFGGGTWGGDTTWGDYFGDFGYGDSYQTPGDHDTGFGSWNSHGGSWEDISGGSSTIYDEDDSSSDGLTVEVHGDKPSDPVWEYNPGDGSIDWGSGGSGFEHPQKGKVTQWVDKDDPYIDFNWSKCWDDTSLCVACLQLASSTFAKQNCFAAFGWDYNKESYFQALFAKSFQGTLTSKEIDSFIKLNNQRKAINKTCTSSLLNEVAKCENNSDCKGFQSCSDSYNGTVQSYKNKANSPLIY